MRGSVGMGKNDIALAIFAGETTREDENLH
jgi:hypothetical protein